MSSQLCPHCGANRQGMPDEQPCWRCGRLPASHPEPTPFREPDAPPGERRYVPRWLAVTGTLGILLFCGMVLGSVWLFLTAEDRTPGDSSDNENEPVAAATLQTPTAGANSTTPPRDTPFPGEGAVTSESQPSVTNTPAVAVGPFAETSIAMQPTAAPSSTASLLPTPSPAPTATLNSPTPVRCLGAPPTRLSLNQQAQVISPNSVRVRDNPGLIGNVLLNAAQGEIVTIMDGPVCADDFIWWQVQLGTGVMGWMAEGLQDDYFLEPQ